MGFLLYCAVPLSDALGRWWIEGDVAIPLTMGFANEQERDAHWDWHAVDFGSPQANEYEELADKFLGKPKVAGMMECYRQSGDVVRTIQARMNLA